LQRSEVEQSAPIHAQEPPHDAVTQTAFAVEEKNWKNGRQGVPIQLGGALISTRQTSTAARPSGAAAKAVAGILNLKLNHGSWTDLVRISADKKSRRSKTPALN